MVLLLRLLNDVKSAERACATVLDKARGSMSDTQQDPELNSTVIELGEVAFDHHGFLSCLSLWLVESGNPRWMGEHECVH